ALREIDLVLALGEPSEIGAVVIVVRGNSVGEAAAARNRPRNLLERVSDDGVGRRGKASGRSDLVEIHLVELLIGSAVREDAIHRRRVQYRELPRIPRLRETKYFVIEEDEQLVLPDRAAHVRAHLVQDDAVARQAIDVVEVIIGVERGVAL